MSVLDLSALTSVVETTYATHRPSGDTCGSLIFLIRNRSSSLSGRRGDWADTASTIDNMESTIVKDFFNNNKVKAFDVKHKGDQNGGEYCIGTLSTAQGSFRTTVFAKNKGGKQLVNEVRFQSIE